MTDESVRHCHRDRRLSRARSCSVGQVLDTLHQRQSDPEQISPRGRQADRAAAPLNELRAQFDLQSLDLLGDG
jgi:hypothetical protein